jgi:hypothetical protein
MNIFKKKILEPLINFFSSFFSFKNSAKKEAARGSSGGGSASCRHVERCSDTDSSEVSGLQWRQSDDTDTYLSDISRLIVQ